ncbi:MAG: heme-binding domain-containing protein [Gemmatimonadota bacterium]
MKDIRRVVQWAVGALIVALVGIQLVPVDRINPPTETEVPASAQVRAVLRRACYDCHSNETVWPWYSRVAPVSWLVADDVHEGREELNFSTWNRYTAEQQRKKLNKSGEEVAEGEMPPRLYLPLHPDARLTADDRALLRAWSQSLGSRESSGQ